MSLIYEAPLTYLGGDGTINTIDVPRKTMQKAYAQKLITDRDFYQNQFGLYAFIPTGDHLEAKGFGIKAKPMLWQARGVNGDCCYDVMGGTTTQSTEINTCPLVMAMNQCPDEVWNSCFEADIDPETNYIKETEATIFKLAIDAVAEMSVEALIGNLTVGGMLDFTTLTQPTNVSDKDWADVQKVFNSCTGWLTSLMQYGKDCNVLGQLLPEIPDGCIPGATLEEIFNQMICTAGREMRTAMTRSRKGYKPVFIVDPVIFSDVATYVRNCKSKSVQVNGNELTIGGCFTHEMFNWNGDMYSVYYYDGIPIVPEDAITLFDPYTGVDTRSITLTLAGNIGFAARATRLPQAPGDIALRVQKNPDLHCLNLQMASAMRIGAGIADLDYIASSTIYQPVA